MLSVTHRAFSLLHGNRCCIQMTTSAKRRQLMVRYGRFLQPAYCRVLHPAGNVLDI